MSEPLLELGAYLLLRACDAFAVEGTEANDGPREVAAWAAERTWR